MPGNIYLGTFAFVVDPPVSICISSFGSKQFSCFQFDVGITGLRLLPVSEHVFPFADLLRIS